MLSRTCLILPYLITQVCHIFISDVEFDYAHIPVQIGSEDVMVTYHAVVAED